MKSTRAMKWGWVVGMALGLGAIAPEVALAQGLPGNYSDSQAVNFTHEEKGFENVSWDSGYFPSNSDLQVKLIAQLDGTTTVDMGGDALTEWPTALDVSVPGRTDAGALKIDYAPSFQAEYKLDTTIKIGPLNIPINQTGTLALPVGPLSNLTLNSDTVFTPFVLPGATPRPVTVVEKLGPQLIPVDVVNFKVAGFDFSLAIELYAALEMSADYQTLDMQVLPATDLIMQEGGSVFISPENPATGFGAFQDLAIQPRGTLDYTGELVFTANAVLSVDSLTINYPLGAEIVPLTKSDSKTDFNVEQVEVPLPDLRLLEVNHDGVAPQASALDFGNVESGTSVTKPLTINNQGKTELLVETKSDNGSFSVSNTMTVAIPPGGSSTVDVAFAPNSATAFTGNLTLTTNDPDLPTLTVPLSGTGTDPTGNGNTPPGDSPPVDGDGGSETDTETGCGCRVVAPSSNPMGAATLLLLCLGWAARRRSSSAETV